MNFKHPYALDAASVDRLVAKGIVKVQNPELPWEDPAKAKARAATRMCQARRYAELTGKDTSKFPARVRRRKAAPLWKFKQWEAKARSNRKKTSRTRPDVARRRK